MYGDLSWQTTNSVSVPKHAEIPEKRIFLTYGMDSKVTTNSGKKFGETQKKPITEKAKGYGRPP